MADDDSCHTHMLHRSVHRAPSWCRNSWTYFLFWWQMLQLIRLRIYSRSQTYNSWLIRFNNAHVHFIQWLSFMNTSTNNYIISNEFNLTVLCTDTVSFHFCNNQWEQINSKFWHILNICQEWRNPLSIHKHFSVDTSITISQNNIIITNSDRFRFLKVCVWYKQMFLVCHMISRTIISKPNTSS